MTMQVRERGGTAGAPEAVTDVRLERPEALAVPASPENALRLLATMGGALAACLDVRSSLQAFLEAIVPAFVDAVAVELVGDSGAHGLAHQHSAPGRGCLLDGWRSRWPPERFVHGGATELHTDAAGALSTVCSPLVARGRVLGAVVLLREPGRGFDPFEVDAAQEIVRLAALALDNAMLYEQAQAANRAKDEFLGIVSHELRTPLNAILGWASILARDPDNQQTVEHGLRIIERNAKVQAKLIEDILDVSRIISGKLRIDQRGVDLCAVLRAGVESVKNQAEAKGIEIGVEIADAPCLALGDGERLQQVVWNLLTNAVKFTPKGGHVWVRLSRQRNAFVIEVRDDGKGIEAPLLPHVFERFRQGDSSTKRAHGGLGLGLAIARHLVEAHGGSIEAASAGSGAGSLFTVKLPIPALLSIEDILESGSSPLLPLDGTAAPTLHGRRLLVVEDEADAREMVVVALRAAGAMVTAYGTASDAYRAIAQGDPPDVLISDIGMPGEDGFELIRRIRALDGLRGKLPAIALTAYTRPEDARMIFMAGFQVHLPKPVDAGLLTAAVANLAG
jgi:signal transduction histidine kinase/CheY-like chemotaxis protein